MLKGFGESLAGGVKSMRRSIARLSSTLVAVLAAGGLAACDRGASNPPAPEVLRLGALVPLSGDSAPTGLQMIPGFQLAVNEANEAGGVLGHRVELVSGDDGCDPQTAVTAANAIVVKDITVSVGGYCSSATVPTLKVFRKADVPMIIPGANSTDLLAPRYDNVFLLAGTTAIEAQRAVEWMGPLRTRRLALIHDGTSFSQTIVQAAAKSITQPGSRITLAAELRLSQGAEKYPRIVEAVLASRADMVFYTSYYAEGGKLIRDLRSAGYAGKIMLSDGGVDPSLFRQVSAAQAEGVYGIALPMAQFTPGVAAWSGRYEALAGRPPGPFSMQAYDAARLALDAVRRAGTLDHAAVRVAIATTAPGDIDLLSGPSKFTSDGTQVDPTFIRLRVHNGTFTLADPAGG
jgi:branched-chain amino acid transport system substrate-binding protein